LQREASIRRKSKRGPFARAETCAKGEEGACRSSPEQASGHSAMAQDGGGKNAGARTGHDGRHAGASGGGEHGGEAPDEGQSRGHQQEEQPADGGSAVPPPGVIRRQDIGAGMAMHPEAGAWLSFNCSATKTGDDHNPGGGGACARIWMRQRRMGADDNWSAPVEALDLSHLPNNPHVVSAPAVIPQRHRNKWLLWLVLTQVRQKSPISPRDGRVWQKSPTSPIHSPVYYS